MATPMALTLDGAAKASVSLCDSVCNLDNAKASVSLCDSVCNLDKQRVAQILCSPQAPQLLSSLRRLNPSQLRPQMLHSRQAFTGLSQGRMSPVKLCCDRDTASSRQLLPAGGGGDTTVRAVPLGSFFVDEVGAFDCRCSGERCRCQNVKRTVCDCHGTRAGTRTSNSSISTSCTRITSTVNSLSLSPSPSPCPCPSPSPCPSPFRSSIIKNSSCSTSNKGRCQCGRWQRQSSERLTTGLPRYQVVRDTVRWHEWSEYKEDFVPGDYKTYTYYIQEVKADTDSEALSSLTPEFKTWVERFAWRRREGPSQRPSRLTLCQAFFDPPRRGPRDGVRTKAKAAVECSKCLLKNGALPEAQSLAQAQALAGTLSQVQAEAEAQSQALAGTLYQAQAQLQALAGAQAKTQEKKEEEAEAQGKKQLEAEAEAQEQEHAQAQAQRGEQGREQVLGWRPLWEKKEDVGVEGDGVVVGKSLQEGAKRKADELLDSDKVPPLQALTGREGSLSPSREGEDSEDSGSLDKNSTKRARTSPWEAPELIVVRRAQMEGLVGRAGAGGTTPRVTLGTPGLATSPLAQLELMQCYRLIENARKIIWSSEAVTSVEGRMLQQYLDMLPRGTGAVY